MHTSFPNYCSIMAKHKTTSLLGRPAKRSRKDELCEDSTNGLSIREQAEQYRLATAKFPVDALTPSWSIGSNRPIDTKHVQTLCQIFEVQRLQREPVENRLRIACSQAEVQRMMEHLEKTGEQPLETSSPWPSFWDWMSINGRKAEIMAGQHRVEALKVFLQRRNQLHESLEENPEWWLCDIYDKGTS